MNIQLTFHLTLIFVILPTILFSQEDQSISGAVVVVSVLGEADTLDEAGIRKGEELSAGMLIPLTHSVITEQASSVTLLLSNGTTLSVQEKSVLQVSSFKQKPFEANGRKLSDLKEEPSSSQITIDLDMGSLVVKTKKLNRSSTLDIHSPVGVAGIRGTEFQMGIQPDGGLQLDVTESTVSFTPPGGQVTLVPEGRGLDVSNVGISSPRPVNPVTAQNITVVNEAATQASADIPLESVTQVLLEIEAEELKAEQSTIPEDDSSTPSNEENGQSAPQKNDGGERMQETVPQVNIEEMLEQNPDAKQVRKSGEIGASAEELQKFPLKAAALERFLSMPQEVQKQLISYDFSVLERLMEMPGFGIEQAIGFLGYSPEARALILGLDDTPLLALLEQGLEEAVVVGTLSVQNLELAGSENLPSATIESPLESRILELGNSLRESGNDEVYGEILEMAGGIWTEEWLRTAEVANLVLQDYKILPDGTGAVFLSGGEVFANPFYLEMASLYQTLENDVMVWGNDPNFLGGSSIELLAGRYDFSDSMGQSSVLVVGAQDTLSMSGQFSVDFESRPDTRVVLMGGENLELSDGTSLSSSLNDLVLSSRSDILLRDASLESAREIAIRSLRDIQMEQVSLSASDIIRFRAEHDINLNGVSFNAGLPFLIMEANTIRLSNIDFPLATQVHLNSLKGPIDGRYPNFGTSIPLSDQIGRVNFIENIKSGGNPLLDRASFDQFGGNITIGKLP